MRRREGDVTGNRPFCSRTEERGDGPRRSRSTLEGGGQKQVQRRHRLLAPAWVPLFDYPKLEWIEQEIFPDPPKGERRAIDILAKMPTTKPTTGSKSSL